MWMEMNLTFALRPGTMRCASLYFRDGRGGSYGLYRIRNLLLICMFILHAPVVLAGGSWEKVIVERITLLNGTDYELVVLPDQQNTTYQDPYMGNCSRFTVKGGYSWVHSWRFPENVTPESHKSALAYIQQAQTLKEAIFLGWVGTGFVAIDPANPCVVRSRALQLLTEGGITAVISFHDGI